MSEIWERDLMATEKLIALAMADHADHDGGSIYPSTGMLAWKTGCSEDTVLRTKRKLIERGLLVKVAERMGKSTIYRMDFAAVPKLARRSDPPAGCDPPQGATPPQDAVAPPRKVRDTPPQDAGHNHQEPSSEPSPSPAPSAEAPKPSEHTLFVKAWGDAYEETFGDPYIFAGGKDGSAVKRLLKTGVPPDELLAIARAAWSHNQLFNCKQAASIAGFAGRLNDIRAELRAKKPKASQLSGWEAEVNAPLK